jgi:hypothetical protein
MNNTNDEVKRKGLSPYSNLGNREGSAHSGKHAQTSAYNEMIGTNRRSFPATTTPRIYTDTKTCARV